MMHITTKHCNYSLDGFVLGGNWRNISMRNRWGFLLTLVALTFITASRSKADGVVKGHILVNVQTDGDIGAIDKDYDTTTADHIIATGLYSINTPAKYTDDEFVKHLKSDPHVTFAEPDTYMVTPEVDGDPFHFPVDRSMAPANYFAQRAFTQVKVGDTLFKNIGAGVVIAVLDTGATFNHPALANHYIQGYNALCPANPPQDIPDGKNNNDTGHGTMIAGIIARLAPGAKIMPVRVLNGDGVGTVLSVAEGIDYAVSHGANIINLSLGSIKPSQALSEAVEEANEAGVLIVCAAGNGGSSHPYYPAAYDGVLAVSSVDPLNRKSSFANYGSYISVVAPGNSIRSAYWNGGYATWSGTSFSVPFVCAEAALIMAKYPLMNSDQVSEWIQNTSLNVNKNNPAYSDKLGEGIIDIESAIADY